MKSTLQTVTLLLGIALALVARFYERPALLWPAFILMVIGASIRFIRMGR
jgi:hypothetical protein